MFMSRLALLLQWLRTLTIFDASTDPVFAGSYFSELAFLKDVAGGKYGDQLKHSLINKIGVDKFVREDELSTLALMDDPMLFSEGRWMSVESAIESAKHEAVILAIMGVLTEVNNQSITDFDTPEQLDHSGAVHPASTGYTKGAFDIGERVATTRQGYTVNGAWACLLPNPWAYILSTRRRKRSVKKAVFDEVSQYFEAQSSALCVGDRIHTFQWDEIVRFNGGGKWKMGFLRMKGLHARDLLESVYLDQPGIIQRLSLVGTNATAALCYDYSGMCSSRVSKQFSGPLQQLYHTRSCLQDSREFNSLACMIGHVVDRTESLKLLELLPVIESTVLSDRPGDPTPGGGASRKTSSARLIFTHVMGDVKLRASDLRGRKYTDLRTVSDASIFIPHGNISGTWTQWNNVGMMKLTRGSLIDRADFTFVAHGHQINPYVGARTVLDTTPLIEQTVDRLNAALRALGSYLSDRYGYVAKAELRAKESAELMNWLVGDYRMFARAFEDYLYGVSKDYKKDFVGFLSDSHLRWAAEALNRSEFSRNSPDLDDEYKRKSLEDAVVRQGFPDDMTPHSAIQRMMREGFRIGRDSGNAKSVLQSAMVSIVSRFINYHVTRCGNEMNLLDGIGIPLLQWRELKTVRKEVERSYRKTLLEPSVDSKGLYPKTIVAKGIPMKPKSLPRDKHDPRDLRRSKVKFRTPKPHKYPAYNHTGPSQACRYDETLCRPGCPCDNPYLYD